MKDLLPSIPYDSKTARLNTGCGSLYLTVVYNKEDTPVKVFLQLGKAGGCVKAHLSILSEHVNVALSESLEKAITQISRLTGITCSESSSCVQSTVNFLLEELLKTKEAQNDHEE